MKNWYKVSTVGWFVTLIYSGLTVYTIRQLFILEETSFEIELIEGAFVIQVVVFLILLYAKYKQQKLFKK